MHSISRSDLEDYDHRLIPNALERRWSPGLDLGLKLQEEYAQLGKLLEQAETESKRVPSDQDAEGIQRTEEEEQALKALQDIEERLQQDEEQLAVFDRGPVGTVRHFNKLAQGWSSRYVSVFGSGPPRAYRDGVEGGLVDTDYLFMSEMVRATFRPTPLGQRRIQEHLADALATAQALDSDEGRQALQGLLESLQGAANQARASIATLEEAAAARFRRSEQRVQDITAERLQARLKPEE